MGQDRLHSTIIRCVFSINLFLASSLFSLPLSLYYSIFLSLSLSLSTFSCTTPTTPFIRPIPFICNFLHSNGQWNLRCGLIEYLLAFHFHNSPVVIRFFVVELAWMECQRVLSLKFTQMETIIYAVYIV